MKKNYLLMLFGLFAGALMAGSTYNVTFKVDMNNYTGASYSAVYVNGTFNSWCGSCNALTDTDKDGVWEGTFQITADSIEFKYTLDGWNGQESLTSGTSCTKTTSGFTNRFLKLTSDVVLSKVCYASCSACASLSKKSVTFNVNMKQYSKSFSKVYVAGTFNSWSANANELTDSDGDKIYSLTLDLTDDSIEYKFQVDQWADDEKLTSGTECTKTSGSYTNRFLKLTGNKVLPNVCWAQCGECTNDVTFKVDMNKYSGSFTTVNVNGTFNGWCGACNALTDTDKDGIWEVTLPLPQDSIEYKFTLDGWSGQESLKQGLACTKTTSGYTNRFLKITGKTDIGVVCWESCTSCASTPTKSTVTFFVDMKNYTKSYTNVNLNGSFNNWCGTCIAMTDANSDKIYEVTVPLNVNDTIEYKFTVDGWSDDEKFVGGEPCTKTTGSFTNRLSVISKDTVNMPVVCWASCSDCNAAAVESSDLVNQMIFPNPANGQFYISTVATVVNYSITDVTGKVVVSAINHAVNQPINIEKLTPGYYQVAVKAAGKTTVNGLVVKP